MGTKPTKGNANPVVQGGAATGASAAKPTAGSTAQITPGQAATAFHAWDTNADGVLSRDEFTTGMAGMDPHEPVQSRSTVLEQASLQAQIQQLQQYVSSVDTRMPPK